MHSHVHSHAINKIPLQTNGRRVQNRGMRRDAIPCGLRERHCSTSLEAATGANGLEAGGD